MVTLPTVGGNINTWGPLVNAAILAVEDMAEANTAAIAALGGSDGTIVTAASEGILPHATTNQTTAVNTVIQDMSTAGGGVLWFAPGIYRGDFVLRQNVHLVSGSMFRGGAVTFKGMGTAWVVDTLVNEYGMGLSGIYFEGSTTGGTVSSATGGAIRFRSGVSGSIIANFKCSFFADQGILMESGSVSNRVDNGYVDLCVLDRARGAYTGAIEDRGTDSMWSHIEAGTSAEAVDGGVSSSGFCVGVMIGSTSSEWHNVVGQISDTGIVVDGIGNRVTDCRGDLNYHHDWVINGIHNQILGALAQGGGRTTTNTYDGFLLTSASHSNILQGRTFQPGAGTYKYDVEDLGSYATYGPQNNRIDVEGYSYGTRHIKTITAIPSTTGQVLRPTTGTTWDVTEILLIEPSYGSAATITQFNGGTYGQTIKILGDADVTIQNNSKIKTTTGANVVTAANRLYVFTNFDAVTDGGYWVQEG